MTSLYAWFTTFTTIGFGGYVPFEALQRKLDQGEVFADGVIVPGLALTLPWMVRFLVTNMKTLLCGRSENYNTTEGRDEDINRSMKIIR